MKSCVLLVMTQLPQRGPMCLSSANETACLELSVRNSKSCQDWHFASSLIESSTVLDGLLFRCQIRCTLCKRVGGISCQHMLLVLLPMPSASARQDYCWKGTLLALWPPRRRPATLPSHSDIWRSKLSPTQLQL